MNYSVPPGVPFFVKLLLVPIEIFGILLKPTVLMIRLTANISAGYIILSFVSLIFIFGENSQAGGLGVGVFSTLFMIFMYLLELLVAFLRHTYSPFLPRSIFQKQHKNLIIDNNYL